MKLGAAGIAPRVLAAGVAALLLALIGYGVKTTWSGAARGNPNADAPASPEREPGLARSAALAEALSITDEPDKGAFERAPVPPLAPEPEAGAELAAPARAGAVEIPKQDPERAAGERAARELEHERATAKGRAEQAAKQLNLTEAQSVELAELYLAFGHRRRDTLAALRARQADHETMRQALQDLGTWQNDELSWQFGRELAGKIQDLDALVSPARDPRAAGK